MYFLLSKILLFLIFPIYWIIALLLIAAFTKRAKLRKRAAIIAVIMLLFFSNNWLNNLYKHAWEYPPVNLPDTAHYSAAILLGGYTSQVSDTVGHFNRASDRFIQSVRLYYTGKVSNILVSGGNGTLNPRQFTEGGWTKKQLRQLGIPDSAILIEKRSRNTLENAIYSAALLKSSNLKPPYLLVTSAFHMRRALMIFKHAGVNVVAYPCNFMSGDITRPTLFDMIPDLEVLLDWDDTIKEQVGYVVNYFMKAKV